KAKIVVQRACMEGVVRVDVHIVAAAPVLQHRLEKHPRMIGLILCDRADDVRKRKELPLLRRLCRKLVPHPRLTLARKTARERTERLRLGKLHALPPLHPHYGQEGKKLYKNSP